MSRLPDRVTVPLRDGPILVEDSAGNVVVGTGQVSVVTYPHEAGYSRLDISLRPWREVTDDDWLREPAGRVRLLGREILHLGDLEC